MNRLNPYLKAVVAIIGTVLTGLSTYYGQAHWFPIVTSVVTAISVYLVPNTPSTPAAKSDG